MEGTPRAITWEAPEHHHVEKGNDWFFALAIIIVALTIAAVLFGNILFALLIGVAGSALAISAAKGPRIVPYAVTVRGIRIEDKLFTYPSLTSYHIDEDDPRGPQLLIKADQRFMPLLVIPIPTEYIDDIEAIISERLEEEELSEPFLVKVLELFGF